jgi:hypothetical protein
MEGNAVSAGCTSPFHCLLGHELAGAGKEETVTRRHDADGPGERNTRVLMALPVILRM